MARGKHLENMSYAELAAMQARVERARAEKQNAERTALRQKLTDIARQHGFDIHELIGRGRKGKGKGTVAVKYRDADGNTWTGRGRMPRWLVAATRGGKARKEDFLIK